MRFKILLAGCVVIVGAAAVAGACGGRTLEAEPDYSPRDAGDLPPSTGGGRPIPPSFGATGPGSGGFAVGGAGGGNWCGGQMTSCDGVCVDTARDANHCGSCYRSCGYGELCVAGVCRSEGSTNECLPNETQCPNWGCIDLSSNVWACGDCYSYCSNGEPCINGACVYGTCLDGATFCDGDYPGCVSDFDFNWEHCGSCNNRCGDYESCEYGTCVRPNCDDYCYYDYYDAGSCNYSYCERSGCTDIFYDIANCGGCEQSCTGSRSVFTWDAHVCNNGTCACSALAAPCGSGCAMRFSYCPPAGYAGSEIDLCKTQARNAYDLCGCDNCLAEITACSTSAACINAMDCTLQSPCVGCGETFYSCYDNYGESNPLADTLVACLNRACASP